MPTSCVVMADRRLVDANARSLPNGLRDRPEVAQARESAWAAKQRAILASCFSATSLDVKQATLLLRRRDCESSRAHLLKKAFYNFDKATHKERLA